MARPSRIGLDYFPLDVDFFSDIKIRKILKGLEIKGVGILICLLCNIYRGDGYYMSWDDETAFLVAEECRCKEATVSELVDKAIKVGFFDSALYERFGILTSAGIQNRYREATRGRKARAIKLEFLVSSEETGVSGVETRVSSEETRVSYSHNPQSKVKESKVKEKKVKEIKKDNDGNARALAIIGSDSSSALPVDRLVRRWSQFTGHIPQHKELDALTAWLHDGVDVDLIIACMDSAEVYNGRCLAYLQKVLQGALADGCKTAEDFERRQDQRQVQTGKRAEGQKQKRRKSASGNFEERTYSAEYYEQFYEPLTHESGVQ